MLEEFNIRLAKISDIKNVFNLSNDEIVRQNSIHKEKILWENHVKWFEDRIKNITYPFYIIEDVSGNFIGQVRFENQGNEIIISISIVKDFRGKGLAGEIIKQCVKKANFKNVSAYIFEENASSRCSFEKAGFKKSRLLKFEYEANFVCVYGGGGGNPLLAYVSRCLNKAFLFLKKGGFFVLDINEL